MDPTTTLHQILVAFSNRHGGFDRDQIVGDLNDLADWIKLNGFLPIVSQNENEINNDQFHVPPYTDQT